MDRLKTWILMKERAGCIGLLRAEMARDVEFSGSKEVWLESVHVKRGCGITRSFRMWQAERSAQMEAQVWRMEITGFAVVVCAGSPSCRRTVSGGLVGERGEREGIDIHQRGTFRQFSIQRWDINGLDRPKKMQKQEIVNVE
ncbi:MAG: hypothetical protein Q9207_000313 [Kuettlingeria erythrocarpa]